MNSAWRSNLKWLKYKLLVCSTAVQILSVISNRVWLYCTWSILGPWYHEMRFVESKTFNPIFALLPVPCHFSAHRNCVRPALLSLNSLLERRIMTWLFEYRAKLCLIVTYFQSLPRFWESLWTVKPRPLQPKLWLKLDYGNMVLSYLYTHFYLHVGPSLHV
jgi:hypothetical protein